MIRWKSDPPTAPRRNGVTSTHRLARREQRETCPPLPTNNLRAASGFLGQQIQSPLTSIHAHKSSTNAKAEICALVDGHHSTLHGWTYTLKIPAITRIRVAIPNPGGETALEIPDGTRPHGAHRYVMKPRWNLCARERTTSLQRGFAADAAIVRLPKGGRQRERERLRLGYNPPPPPRSLMVDCPYAFNLPAFGYALGAIIAAIPEVHLCPHRGCSKQIQVAAQGPQW